MTMKISADLKTLLKIAHRAHPVLHALPSDLRRSKPKFVVDADARATRARKRRSTTIIQAWEARQMYVTDPTPTC